MSKNKSERSKSGILTRVDSYPLKNPRLEYKPIWSIVTHPDISRELSSGDILIGHFLQYQF